MSVSLTPGQNHDLLNAAIEAADSCYAPYSEFPVGAAVLTASGEVITGANVENVSYGLTLCAERVAVLKAITEGHRKLVALAVWARKLPNGGITPCGACRQVMLEFMSPEAPILFMHPETGVIQSLPLGELLPVAFGFADHADH